MSWLSRKSKKPLVFSRLLLPDPLTITRTSGRVSDSLLNALSLPPGMPSRMLVGISARDLRQVEGT